MFLGVTWRLGFCRAFIIVDPVVLIGLVANGDSAQGQFSPVYKKASCPTPLPLVFFLLFFSYPLQPTNHCNQFSIN